MIEKSASRAIDLDGLDRAMTGEDFDVLRIQQGPMRALIAELRASRKVVEAARHLIEKGPRSPGAYSGLFDAVAELSSINAIGAEGK